MQLWAILKTIPILASVLEAIAQSYQMYQIAQIVDQSEAKKEEINFVTEKIKYAKTNDERRILLRILYKL